MSIYKLVNGNTIIADAAFIAEHFPNAVYVGEDPPVIEQKSFLLSKPAFKNRVPRAKWVAAKGASAASPILADFFEDFVLAKYMDCQYPDTVAAIRGLTDPNVPAEFQLTQEEADAILLVPCQPGEEP